MKRTLSALLAVLLALALVTPVFAEPSRVTYQGDAGEFIFEPGSLDSPTDLFENFKDVMPGDSLVQSITVKNDVSKNVKVRIYLRSLGAHDGSEEFLSQLHLRVEKKDAPGAYMFDASPDETAGLTEWVYLGTLYSGGEVDLNVILDVPTSLDNTFREQKGFLDWQFMIEELPVDPDDPQTGDTFPIETYTALFFVSLTVLILLFILVRRRKKKT